MQTVRIMQKEELSFLPGFCQKWRKTDKREDGSSPSPSAPSQNVTIEAQKLSGSFLFLGQLRYKLLGILNTLRSGFDPP